ncbi:Amidohydrolase [Corynebacterium glaucum]|uniref:amidohydrolase family protein n=1 Tax=Corynebacterium glaucum TaxID=187491 RepID=UPI0025B5E8F3|nr:amidohydrolase family protein [Corynebacterium glaucum]WJZ08749.1 Amidohydrolase [Corynebacterium glaucum]
MLLFDAHFHIISPDHPLVENSGFMPEPYTVADYRSTTETWSERGYEVRGGAIVSGSFQAFDQGYLTEGLSMLGDGFVGVTQLPADVPDSQVLELDAAGVRAVRFNFKRGGSAGVKDLELLAHRVYDLAGWHTELYVDSRELDELAPVLARLPRISIGHLGMHQDGLDAMLRLVERGAMVKATGFGRVELDPAKTMAAVLRVNPGALMVGTDVPSTRAKRPFEISDLDLIAQTVTDALGAHAVEDVFWNNAARWYLHRT